MISDKEYEDYVKACPVQSGSRIGGKKEAIQAIKEMGWGKYGIDKMKKSFNEDGGYPIYRIGRIYYWRSD
tara:strand:+ start:18 stop:227 length:210 start_codon:yes stop_codon:yes gene_type:complete